MAISVSLPAVDGDAVAGVANREPLRGVRVVPQRSAVVLSARHGHGQRHLLYVREVPTRLRVSLLDPTAGAQRTPSA
jgi:hypothetical protein